MRRHQAKRRLKTSHESPDRVADDLLANALEAERGSSVGEPTPFAAFKQRVTEDAAVRHRKDTSIMSYITDRIMTHRRLSLSLGSAVVALLLMALIPVSCTQTTGYAVDVVSSQDEPAVVTQQLADGSEETTISIELLDSLQPGETVSGSFGVGRLEVDLDKVKSTLAELGLEDANLTISDTPTERRVHVGGLDNEEDARRAAIAVSEILGMEGQTEVQKVRESVRSSVLNYLGASLISIVVDSRGKTDEEISDEIRTKLTGAGLDDCSVYYRDNGDNQTIWIGTDGAEVMAIPDGAAVGFTAKAGDTALGDTPKTIMMQNLDGASPDEIRKQIKQQLDSQGVDGNVTIDLKKPDSAEK